jgi:large subunit ribosomal protein L15
MMIHEITKDAGRHKRRIRVGRGEGSGRGKTSGRGNKGAGSRSGTAAKKAFEGGQMPLFRRLRKYGFSNVQFATNFWIVNLVDIVNHPAFANGGKVNAEALIKAGLIRDLSRDLKILGDLGDAKALKVKLDIEASRVTASVRKLVLAAGGSVNELGTLRDSTRGVDRNSEDRSPKNLTKKLKRGKKKPVAGEAEAKGGEAADKGDKGEKAPKAEKPAKAPKAKPAE